MKKSISRSKTRKAILSPREEKGSFFKLLLFSALGFCAVVLAMHALPAFAQSALEGRISQTVSALIRIVNVIIAGFIVWAGFLIAKGEHSGFHRLIYGVVGLVVANAAYLIINYFSWF